LSGPKVSHCPKLRLLTRNGNDLWSSGLLIVSAVETIFDPNIVRAKASIVRNSRFNISFLYGFKFLISFFKQEGFLGI
jgi:hypothetical protein